MPKESVVALGGKHVSIVLTDDGPESRNVVVGKSNAASIEILDGLSEGEEVVVNPRSDMGDMLDSIEADMDDDEEHASEIEATR